MNKIRALIVAALLAIPLSMAHADGTMRTKNLFVYSGVNWNTLTQNAWQLQCSSIAAAGFGGIRHNTNVWGYIETSSGALSAANWAQTDWFIGIATGAGLTVVWTFSSTPSTQTATVGWAPSYSCPTTDYWTGATVGCSNTPTTDTGVIYRFARAFANRYRGLPVIAEVPNEMDFSLQNRGVQPSSTDTVRVWQAIYEGVKSTAPTMAVWAGALFDPAGNTMPGTTNYTNGNMFRDMLIKGATNCLTFDGVTRGFCGDAVSIHTYRNASDTFEVDVSTILLHLAAVGITTIPVVVSETSDFGTLAYPAGDVAFWENSKAVWLAQQYPRLYALGVTSVTWHTFDYGAFALSTNTTQALLAANAFQTHFVGKTFQRLKDSGNLRVAEWRNLTTGRRAWSVYSASGSTTVKFNGMPRKAIVYDKLGTSLGTYYPSDFSGLSVSSSPVIISEQDPPGVQIGRE